MAVLGVSSELIRQADENGLYSMAVVFDEPLSIDEQALAMLLVGEAMHVAELLISKRRDYGSANVGLTGLMGLAVRMVDKAARLWNLVSRDADPAINETLEDTLTDLIGYALMAKVIEGGNQW